MNKLPPKPICDFCKSPEVVTCFLTEPTTTIMSNPDTGQKLVIQSDEHWVSCARCAVAVRLRDRVGLTHLSYTYGPKVEEGVPITRVGIAVTQSTMFWAGFKGQEHSVDDHERES
jgi:hypothetical protein